MSIFRHDCLRNFSLLVEHEDKFTRIIRHDRADNRLYDILVPTGQPVTIDVVDGMLSINRGKWVKVA